MGRVTTAMWIAALAGAGILVSLDGLQASEDGQPAIAASMAIPSDSVGAASGVAQGTSGCVITGTKTAAPEQVLLGETVDVTITAQVDCPTPALDIVLVLDGSGSMSGANNQQLRQASRAFVTSLDLEMNPDVEVGVVSFSETTQTLCQLTNSTSRVLSCINRLGATGETDVGAGIDEGLAVLLRETEPARRVMILATDAGSDQLDCPSALQAAGQAKDLGTTLHTICIGRDCDNQCVQQLASSNAMFHQAQNPNNLEGVFEDISDEIAVSDQAVEATIIDRLGDRVALVPDSAAPAPSDASTDRRLVWRFATMPTAGITVSLAVSPTRGGFVPTNAGARAIITDSGGMTATLDYADPSVLVLRPDPVETDTPTPEATAEASATPTMSATDMPEPTATATLGDEEFVIYLPIVLRGVPLSPHDR